MNREDKLGDTGDLVRPVVLCAIVFICKMQKRQTCLLCVTLIYRFHFLLLDIVR